ncbi:hypothetical protein ACWEWG_01305 [Streptomyces sp. NPDC003758]
MAVVRARAARTSEPAVRVTGTAEGTARTSAAPGDAYAARTLTALPFAGRASARSRVTS